MAKAGDYVLDLRLAKGFIRELRFIRIMRSFGAEGVLGVILLWDWVAHHYPDGMLAGVKAEDILDAAQVNPERTDFVDALIDQDFLEMLPDGTGFVMVNWDREQPWVANAEERRQKASRAAAARWKSKQKQVDKCDFDDDFVEPMPEAYPEQCQSDASSMPGACHQQCECNAPKPKPNIKSTPLPPKGDSGDDVRTLLENLVELWKEILPELDPPKEINETMVGRMKKLLKKYPERGKTGWWRDYFGRIREYPHLMGRNGTWRATLLWSLKGSSVDKVLSGEFVKDDLPGSSAPVSYTEEEFKKQFRVS